MRDDWHTMPMIFHDGVDALASSSTDANMMVCMCKKARVGAANKAELLHELKRNIQAEGALLLNSGDQMIMTVVGQLLEIMQKVTVSENLVENILRGLDTKDVSRIQTLSASGNNTWKWDALSKLMFQGQLLTISDRRAQLDKLESLVTLVTKLLFMARFTTQSGDVVWAGEGNSLAQACSDTSVNRMG